MPVKGSLKINPKDIVKFYKKHGSLKKLWKAEFPTLSWTAVQAAYVRAVQEELMPPLRVGTKSTAQLKDPSATIEQPPKGRVRALETKELPVPKRGVKTYLFTCAQNNTAPFMPFWNNLKVLAEHYNAKIHVARFVYLANSMASALDKHKAFEKSPDPDKKEDIHWNATFRPYFSDDRMEVAPGLVWCGEMNILPTAENPLSGLEVYTGRKSAIIPHTKVAMQSVPSGKHEPTKFNYTTGTATLRHYIQRKAGLKAEFHHTYGALLVEVDSDGDWFCRQIIADSEGVIQDLDVKVDATGELTTGNRVEAIGWGDVHVDELVEWVAGLCWGEGGMLDTLRPSSQFFHDVHGFKARGHHDLKHPHMQFRRYLLGQTDVRAESVKVCEFLTTAVRIWCDNVVVDSNHHDHMGRWLEEQDGRLDPKNAEFWTAMQARVWKDLRDGAETPNYFRLMVEEVDPALVEHLRILKRDDSYIICPDRNGGIECAMHGHAGPNGSRGSPRAFAKMGRKANLGHYHAAGIWDGIWWGGTCARLDPDWTNGPGGWSHTHVVTYNNGKRSMVTMWNGKYRAKR
jgi:hypothetical protein